MGVRFVPSRRHDRAQQLVQRGPVLKRAQSRRVGRRDIDRQIVGQGRHAGHARGIVRDPIGRVLVGPDIDADHRVLSVPAGPPALRDSLSRCRLAAIVEAHAVDHRPVLGQPEQPGQGITLLRQGCQRSQFGKAEAQPVHLVRDQPLLVITRRQAHRIGKGDARHRLAQHRIGFERGRHRHQAQQSDRQMVGALGIQREKQGADQAIGHGGAMPSQSAQVESLLQRGNSKDGMTFLNKIPWDSSRFGSANVRSIQ